jgi:Type II secretion system (T2SS), protein G
MKPVHRIPISLKGLALGAVAGFVLFQYLASVAANVRADDRATARHQVRKIGWALEYFLDDGRCPTTPTQIRENDFLTPRDLIDPWGTSIAYSCSCSDVDFHVRSAGRDGIFNTTDDITETRWTN